MASFASLFLHNPAPRALSRIHHHQITTGRPVQLLCRAQRQATQQGEIPATATATAIATAIATKSATATATATATDTSTSTSTSTDTATDIATATDATTDAATATAIDIDAAIEAATDINTAIEATTDAATATATDIDAATATDIDAAIDAATATDPHSRRLALTLLVAVAAISTKVSPADATYGESANIFGKPKNNTDFSPYNGTGFKLLIPTKWNPSKEREFPGQVLRYEDNFDPNSNVNVMITPTTKKTISEYGSPEEFLSQVDYLLGKQAYSGKTISEGGFDPDVVATANILESSTSEIGGKKYYSISILTRTADGDEGGKHQLITATASGGKLYICKAEAGDKSGFEGARKFMESTASSFNVA